MWDEPQGRGPELVVDVYRIYILPFSLSYPNNSVAATNSSDLLLDITVEYNKIYETNLTAVNCAGESDITTMPFFEYGEFCYNQ